MDSKRTACAAGLHLHGVRKHDGRVSVGGSTPSDAEFMLLSYLGRQFVDAAPWDARHHWQRTRDTSLYKLVEDFTMADGGDDKHAVILEKKDIVARRRIRQPNRGYSNFVRSYDGSSGCDSQRSSGNGRRWFGARHVRFQTHKRFVRQNAGELATLRRGARGRFSTTY
jgi:hypothetical protein